MHIDFPRLITNVSTSYTRENQKHGNTADFRGALRPLFHLGMDGRLAHRCRLQNRLGRARHSIATYLLPPGFDDATVAISAVPIPGPIVGAGDCRA